MVCFKSISNREYSVKKSKQAIKGKCFRIVLYLLCMVSFYCWQIKGFGLEHEALQDRDREEYSKLEVEVEYYLKRFETESRQMWLWSFVDGV